MTKVVDEIDDLEGGSGEYDGLQGSNPPRKLFPRLVHADIGSGPRTTE